MQILHGYSLQFKFTFEARELDERNWVVDFGGLKPLKAWLEDTETYLDYAKKDVELMVRIDEENYTSEAILSLQRLLKAPFDACFYASNMGSIYFMRNASWKAPTGNQEC